MSDYVVVELRAKPDNVQDVKDLLAKALPDTRSYDGFEDITIHQDKDEPTSFMFYERWASRAKYEAYLAWRTETGVLDELVAMLDGAPSFRYFDAVDV
jgi:quinol monooxygenase YgiN